MFIVGLAAIVAYFIYVDAQVQQRFEGNKWQVPAQIFARPLVLHEKQEITPKELIDELTLLGYRKVTNATHTGEYHVHANQLRVKRRAFDYPGGYEPERDIRIQWQGDRISSIMFMANAQTGGRNQKTLMTKLEPWLVSRMVNGLDEDRMLVDSDDIPYLLQKALVIVEDRDFYEHYGIAPTSIIRAFFANIIAGKTVQGGSTLTQQLAKNFFLTRERSYIRKAKEAVMALVIDFRYSKEEILNAYINEVFLGQNGSVAVHGFGLASHFYFDKPLPELSVPEIATLVGLVKGPSYYSPTKYAERTLERRNLVLRLLFEANELERNEYERYVATSLNISKSKSLASGKHPAFMDKVRNELNMVVSKASERLSGVKVYTTLDINAQRRAEAALVEKVESISNSRNQPNLDAAMVVSDVKSGEIRAIVGGKDTTFKGFNRALHAQRPIGSLVKPAVYLAALENPEKYNLATMLDDVPVKMRSTGGKTWEPLNADKEFRGKVALIEALTKSYNVPSVKLGMAVGLGQVAYTINRLGIEKDIEEVPALTLGAIDLSPLQVNQMYQTLANNGVLSHLHTLTAVSSSDNELIYIRDVENEERVDESATYLINYALHKVTLEGTAKAIRQRFPTINMAGKTGTTNDYRDSWFAGFDRNLVTSIWMGADDNQPINLSGASGAMQVFIAFQDKQAPKNLARRFPSTLGIAHFDASTGALSAPGCGDILSVPAILSALESSSQPCNGESAPAKKKTKKKSLWQRLFGD
ncbi:penicillin-binding protein 1B [Glaciecola sp. MH2013]|uniref:penicillin-binding protein 1B n=1 Tax=Glaciecola sp. MH2013 TaxID=2785524 RepID=UPI00189C7C40|nr:penicillin-binding protein 1B [Glaciecola sp. MH2013]MBF7073737.1 penicillin-binding protein 1B [Glaciecola sp. MH2013]